MITIDQVGCARCDGNGHPNIQFVPFLRPVVVGGQTFSHWAMCPETNEPLLLWTSEGDGA